MPVLNIGMSTVANIEARYSAKIIDFEREVKRMQTLNKRVADKILNDQRAAVRDVNGAWAKADIGGALNRSLGNGLGSLRTQLMASIAAITSGAGIAAAVGLADTYNRFTNSLKVAGVEGANLATVQGRLFESANRNGVAVESLGQLYGRVTSASKELGVSQNEVLKVTDAVSAAIRVSGRPVSEASGAMLQMAQALGGGTVRAEEFNSMVEGMLPLVQAAAGASTKYGGSVAKMREDVLKGKLSSKEFFDLILAGSASLEAKAAKAPLTVAQSFEALKNKMIEAIGTTNEAWGITDRLSEALAYLGNNLDQVGAALGIIAVAMAATLAPAVGKAAIAVTTNTVAMVANGAAAVRAIPAQLAFAAALNGTTRSAAAATFGLRLLMSATGIGLAITAITVALGLFAAQSYKAAEASRDAADRVSQKKAALDEARAAADKARVETGNLSKAEMEALTKTAALTGQVDILTTAYGRLAAEAKRARLEILATEARQATADRKTLESDLNRARTTETRRARGPGSYGGADGRQPNPAGFDDLATRVANERLAANPLTGQVADARAVEAAAYNAYNTARDERITVEQPRTNTTSGGPRRSGGGGGGSGTSPEQRAKNSEEAILQAERALRDATRAQAFTASERHAVSLAALEDDKAMAIAAVEKRVKDNEITAVAGARLTELETQTYEARVAAVAASRQRELDEAAIELQTYRNNNLVEAARLDAEELTDKAGLATTREERHDYERQALEAQQRADRLMFDAEQAALRLQLERNGHERAAIDQIIADNEARFSRGQSNARTNQTGQQNRENGPQSIQEWITGMTQAEAAGESFNQKLFGIAEGGLNAITSGLTDALMGAKSFGEAFGDMAKGVVAALIEMGIKFLVFEMLGRAFGMPGLGKAAIGMTTGGGGKKGFASGTDFVGQDGLYKVGEKGEEVVALPRGAQVLPNNLLRNAAKVPNGGGQGGQTIVNQIRVDASGAVLTQEVKGWIYEGVTKGMIATKQMISQDQQKAGRNRLM
ncbi:tape measure protein [Brevundimonas sp. M1A4_2e]